MIRRATFVLLALMSALLPALGQIPDRPVRVIVPFTPAGTSDIVARILVNAVSADFPRGIIVENKGGAGGNIGTVEAARATADGTTLVQCTIGTCGSNPSMYANPGYDLARDFTPVILTGAVRNVMTVRKDLPATNLQEVIALAKAQPGKLNFGSSGVGASNHLAPELLRGRLGIDWTHVPVPRQRPGDHRHHGRAHRRVLRQSSLDPAADPGRRCARHRGGVGGARAGASRRADVRARPACRAS